MTKLDYLQKKKEKIPDNSFCPEIFRIELFKTEKKIENHLKGPTIKE